jgi:hypothetical protein
MYAALPKRLRQDPVIADLPSYVDREGEAL